MGYALSDAQYLNPYNPASFTQINWTNFEAAGMARNTWLSSGNQSQKASITSFNHLSLGFPVTQWWGMGLSVMPLSKVGYSYKTHHELKSEYNDIPYENVFDGTGGLNQAVLSNGFRIKKKLSLGFNLAYYFGNLEYQEVQQFTESDDFHNSAWVNSTEVGGIHFDFGAQYPLKLNGTWDMDIGLVFTPIQGIRSTTNEFGFTYSGGSATPVIIDTISYIENAPFSIVLPPKIGFGVLFSRSKNILAGFEVDYTNWTVTNYNIRTGLSEVISIKVGSEFRIGEKGYKIRVGARYGQVPLVINGENPDEFAGSVGVAIPFRTKDKLSYTEMNIGMEIGQRGQNSSQMILEQFINVHVGIALNNKWFIKRVYD